MNSQLVGMDGYVESDETFMEISFKGNHSKDNFDIPRKITYVKDGKEITETLVYKRGSKGEKARHAKKGIKSKRGLSNDKVCISCSVDKQKHSFASLISLGNCKASDLQKGLTNHIVRNSVFCTDGKKEYKNLVKENNLNWKQFKEFPSDKYGNGIQHINNYHSQLKGWLRHFCGVSTKWLPNYIAMFNFAKYFKGDDDKQISLLKWSMNQTITVTKRTMSKRNAIPILE
jgi:transposase-like protein